MLFTALTPFLAFFGVSSSSSPSSSSSSDFFRKAKIRPTPMTITSPNPATSHGQIGALSFLATTGSLGGGGTTFGAGGGGAGSSFFGGGASTFGCVTGGGGGGGGGGSTFGSFTFAVNADESMIKRFDRSGVR